MRERSIQFASNDLGLLEDGYKTQFRRLVRPQPVDGSISLLVGDYHPTKTQRNGHEKPGPITFGIYSADGKWHTPCPFGRPGDLLWVREKWHPIGWRPENGYELRYAALPGLKRWCEAPEGVLSVDVFGHNATTGNGWRSAMHMPRWASRITLRVESVRVERVQGISGRDVLAEGVGQPWNGRALDAVGGMTIGIETTLRHRFASAWCEKNGDRYLVWDVNPWVWVVTFSVNSVSPTPADIKAIEARLAGESQP